MLILLLAAIFNNFAESRVYCEDSHATSFIFIGFSCPVNCHNVVEAVKRLKLLDEQNAKYEAIGDYAFNLRQRHTDTHTRRFYLVCERIFENKLATEEVFKELDQYQNITTCNLVFDNYVDENECPRRSNQKQFLTAFTVILNKHAHGLYKFTEDITDMILKKILGGKKLHSDDDTTVNILLRFLRKALARHRRIAHSDSITLRSRHCMLASVPGCFCRTGFVEQSGQCVQPADCLSDDGDYLDYIHRVHVA